MSSDPVETLWSALRRSVSGDDLTALPSSMSSGSNSAASSRDQPFAPEQPRHYPTPALGAGASEAEKRKASVAFDDLSNAPVIH